MKVAITGTNGLVGQHLAHLLLKKGYHVIALAKGQDRNNFGAAPQYSYREIDITDHFSLHDLLFEEAPDVMVHAAAITQIDDCQLNKEHCLLVNEQGTMNVLANAELYCRHLIFISTDFVFDGAKGNYKEEDRVNPVSFYGETKIKGEQLVQRARIPWTILRTCLVYGNPLAGSRTNIVSWVKQSLEQGKPIKVVNDQWRTPTYVEDLAMGILLAIEKKAAGIYHISGKEMMSPYQLALKVAGYFNFDSGLIEEVNASNFSQPARRPPKTGFDISKAIRELGYAPVSFMEGLEKMYGGKT